MQTPFDEVVAGVVARRYHNHRLEDHSDIVSKRIFQDLVRFCPLLAKDVESGIVKHWLNVPAPGARNRKIDLFIGEPDAKGNASISGIRVCVENKSVLTAHRNRDARFDDLDEVMKVVHSIRPDAVTAATVMIGVDQQNLNIPDKVKAFFIGNNERTKFENEILPRLSSGDQSLWTEFKFAISRNSVSDPMKTLAKLRDITTRPAGHTHIAGYDFIIFVPMSMDNVNPPSVVRNNSIGIDVDGDYAAMLDSICRAYKVRWHPLA